MKEEFLLMTGSMQLRYVSRLASIFVSSVVLAGEMSSPLTAMARELHWGGRPDGFYHFNRPIWGDRGALGDDWRFGYRGWHPAFGDGVRPIRGEIDQDRRFQQDNNFYNRNYEGWNPLWRNRGYWESRPWRTGWYSWNPGQWGWWNNNSTAWGLAGLAAGSVITGLVDRAADQQKTVIEVPASPFQLNYASVEAVGNHGASFTYQAGGLTQMGAANCQLGLINGQVPANAAQAQLLNAACHVAYGGGS